MRYPTKQAVITAAQARGSKSTKYSGAAKYLLAQAVDNRELWERGYRVRYSYEHTDRRRADNSRVYDRRAANICARLGLYTLPACEAVAAEYDQPTLVQLRDLSWGYRVSESSWAGGDHTTKWELVGPADCGVDGGSSRAWSSNGKWSGNNSWATVAVSRRAIALLGVGGLYIGGLLTLDVDLVSPRVYRAVWVEQGRGFDLRAVRGYIVRGYHVETDCLATAAATAARARKKTIKTVLAQRAAKRETRIEAHIYVNVWVTAADSITAGNCPNGTRAGENRIKKLLHAAGDIGAVRADVLLAKLIDQKNYVLRAIAAAKNRQEAKIV